MHRLASSIVSFLLSPLNWIIILLIAAFFLRKDTFKKICGIAAVCIFLLFGNGWVLDWYANMWQPPPAFITTGREYSCGVVPGGFASPDGNENGYFNGASDRFIQTVKLFKQGKIKHILVCGGNGKTQKKEFREAVWVKGELMENGIPGSVIFVEDRSNNTADNALHAKQMLDSLQLKPPFLLITSAHHMPRASLLFEKAGVQVVPFPCNYIAGRGISGFSSLSPKFDVLLSWKAYMKESIGYFWYKLRT